MAPLLPPRMMISESLEKSFLLKYWYNEWDAMYLQSLQVYIYMYLSVVEEHCLMTAWYFYKTFAYDTFVNGI